MNAESVTKLLSDMGRYRIARRLRRTAPARRSAQAALRSSVLPQLEAQPDDITVLIGVKNRSDQRLVNALRTIRTQTHPVEMVRPMVVDYGSSQAHADRTERECKEYGAEYVRVEAAGEWSRARCLNIGIRRATTKFLLTSDVDMVFSPRYVADAVAALKARPLAVVCAPMRDLPQQSVDPFWQFAETGRGIDLEYWKAQSLCRFEVGFHPSVATSYTAFFQLLRGYDEFFAVWGEEDRDLMRRLTNLGLSPEPINSESFYLHQWHPKYEGVNAEVGAPVIKRNRTYFRQHHTIIRNDHDWGRQYLAVEPAEATRSPKSDQQPG
jgi:predicted glycosyltransferase involved in capsule biosynthesis